MGNGQTGNDCRECRAGRPHCHGTLIHHGGRHWGRPVQCTEPECTHPEILLHSLSIDCASIGCDCGQQQEGCREAV